MNKELLGIALNKLVKAAMTIASEQAKLDEFDALRNARLEVYEVLDQLVQPCSACNGHGEVGGLRSDGYYSEICPYCKGDGTGQIAQLVQPKESK